VGVDGQALDEAAFPAGAGQVVHHGNGHGEESLEATLDGVAGDGDGEVGVSAAGLAVEDQAPLVDHEVRDEVGAHLRKAQGRMQHEIEVVHGLQDGEAGAANRRWTRVCWEPRIFAKKPVDILERFELETPVDFLWEERSVTWTPRR
jgi:hypothetical protein